MPSRTFAEPGSCDWVSFDFGFACSSCCVDFLFIQIVFITGNSSLEPLFGPMCSNPRKSELTNTLLKIN